MNLKNYTTPAIVAAAAHAALFLIAPDVPTIIREDDVVLISPISPPRQEDPPSPREIDVDADINDVGGPPTPIPPMAPEPPAVVKGDFEMPTPTVVPRDDSKTSDIFKIDPSYQRPNGTGVGPGNGDGARMISFSDLDREPRYRARPAPDYPFTARQSGLEGEVVVEFDVDTDGRVAAARVLRSTDRMFDEPAMRAVLKWRFEPGRKNGRAVAFRMAVPIVFSLENS